MSIKTFDLVPVISGLTNGSSGGNNVDLQIQSMDFDGGQLFVGTSNGWIHRYSVVEKLSDNGRRNYFSKLVASKHTGQKKPVLNLQVIRGINRVLFLCDGTLGMLDAATVELVHTSGSRVKNVTRFSVSDRADPDNPFVSYEVCVARRKSLQLYTIQETHFTLLVEIPVQEPPVEMVYSDPFVCFASTTHYHVVNAKEQTHTIHDLFPFPDRPVIMSLKDSAVHEFLLSGPGGLGMFVSAQSLVAPRPPINWAELRVLRMQYSAPYILVYSNADIWVYSSINQQPKQSLQFDSCCALCEADFDGKRETPLMASPSQIWALENVPWQEQVETLLEDMRVEEALQIARSFLDGDIHDSRYYKDILVRGALVQLHRNELLHAKELLLESETSPLEILPLCPDVFPSKAFNGITEKRNGLRIDLFDSAEPHVRTKRNYFLLGYLEECRRLFDDYSEELSLVLLKLYAQLAHKTLMSFVKSYRNVVHYEEARKVLMEHSRFLALGFFELRSDHVDEALDLFTQLYDGVLNDTVDGSIDINTIAGILKSVDEQNGIIIKYLPWLLKRNDALALTVIKSGSGRESVPIVDLLSAYPAAHLGYVEWLVFDRKNESEDLHVALGMKYLEQLQKLEVTESEVNRDALRRKLRDILSSDNLRNVTLLEPLIDELELHEEKIVLLAKSGDHFKALDLLVHKVKDTSAAVAYCVKYGGRNPLLKRQLFEHLLEIYFNPKDQNEESVRAALMLLNSEEADFDPAKVLSVLPANWSIDGLQRFLTLTMRRSLHNQRMNGIERNLAKSEHVRSRLAFIKSSRGKILLTEEIRCTVCRGRFLESAFQLLENGQVVHVACDIQSRSS